MFANILTILSLTRKPSLIIIVKIIKTHKLALTQSYNTYVQNKSMQASRFEKLTIKSSQIYLSKSNALHEVGIKENFVSVI